MRSAWASIASAEARGIERLQLGDDDTILPGLVDLHAHYKIFVDGNRRDETRANPVIYLANGVTTTFTAGELNPYDILALKQAINRGERIGPRLLNAGPYFGPTNPNWSKDDTAQDVYAQYGIDPGHRCRRSRGTYTKIITTKCRCQWSKSKLDQIDLPP